MSVEPTTEESLNQIREVRDRCAALSRRVSELGEKLEEAHGIPRKRVLAVESLIGTRDAASSTVALGLMQKQPLGSYEQLKRHHVAMMEASGSYRMALDELQSGTCRTFRTLDPLDMWSILTSRPGQEGIAITASRSLFAFEPSRVAPVARDPVPVIRHDDEEPIGSATSPEFRKASMLTLGYFYNLISSDLLSPLLPLIADLGEFLSSFSSGEVSETYRTIYGQVFRRAFTKANGLPPKPQDILMFSNVFVQRNMVLRDLSLSLSDFSSDEALEFSDSLMVEDDED